jgi:hypothetical protein
LLELLSSFMEMRHEVSAHLCWNEGLFLLAAADAVLLENGLVLRIKLFSAHGLEESGEIFGPCVGQIGSPLSDGVDFAGELGSGLLVAQVDLVVVFALHIAAVHLLSQISQDGVALSPSHNVLQ